MNQLNKHDVNKLSASELKARLPFQITNDGEVIAVVLPVQDVNKLAQDRKDTKGPPELMFSKRKQALGRL